MYVNTIKYGGDKSVIKYDSQIKNLEKEKGLGKNMKISLEIINDKVKAEFDVATEKDILTLYEVLGVEICKNFGYDYEKLLILMAKRIEQ